MSLASATRNIKFISKGGTYTAYLTSPQGDIYQFWTGTENSGVVNATSIYPNFQDNPVNIYMTVMSSRLSEGNNGAVVPTFVEFYLGNVKIEFPGNSLANGTTSSNFGGAFEIIAPNVGIGETDYGLKIKKDIAPLCGYQSVSFRCVATVSYGTAVDVVQASCNILIAKETNNGRKVIIESPDNKHFIIDSTGGSCQLRAMAYEKGQPLSSNLAYKWYVLNPASGNTWQPFPTPAAQATTRDITINQSDVNTYAEYMVEVYLTTESTTNPFGTDVQGVMDTTDPYDIDPNPDPADETIEEDVSGNGTVTYTPKIVTRGGTTPAEFANARFYFIVRDGAGNPLNTANTQSDGSHNYTDATAPLEKYVVDRAQCIQADGDISITIISQD